MSLKDVVYKDIIILLTNSDVKTGRNRLVDIFIKSVIKKWMN